MFIDGFLNMVEMIKNLFFRNPHSTGYILGREA